MINQEDAQKLHYNKLSRDYDAHYNDKYSVLYKELFIYRKLFKDIQFKDKIVLEAMCGSGQTAGYLLKNGAKVIGLDISERMLEIFKSHFPDINTVCRSVFSTGLEDGSVDDVVVIGGLHHLHPNVAVAIREIHRILKTGGFFFFAEPHKGSIPDKLRKIWYSKDKNMFKDSEESLDICLLKKEFRNQFEFEYEEYAGNFAYLLILNSLVFRMPKFLKKIYSLPLIFLEKIISPFLGRRFSCFVLCRWRKLK